ncbi:response regulator transcription factor [Homoserinibacter sp. YIM 151385]|uniref:response regulator transcription factor n=1 Tax=Homoserinibacter sp. YIM 151385 TaxID=2985506 RepID=UPI0022F12BF3|nr:response regulator transcription factor [Homoserinibacter sp. YIM 151385]WBU38997.1 response regulator transcription factor [Homoserinibacter sp. YIM 151385]
MSRILVAEDEPGIARFVEKGLRAAGYEVVAVGTGTEALEVIRGGTVDLVLLDVGLPGLDGFSVLRRARGEGAEVPIIMLTARTATADTVAGLDGGANDYIPKPFKFDELLARVRTRIRDSVGAAAGGLARGDLGLDLRTRRASVAGREVELSAREFALAEEFLRHPDQVLSREQLLSRVWGVDFDPGSNVVDVYVRYLRGKLGADRIETVRGMGYRLV